MARNDSPGSVRSRRRRNRALVSAHRSRGFGGPGKRGSRYFLVNCSVISGMGSERVSPAISGVPAIRTPGEIGWAAVGVDPRLALGLARCGRPTPAARGVEPETGWPTGGYTRGECRGWARRGRIASAPNGPCQARIRGREPSVPTKLLAGRSVTASGAMREAPCTLAPPPTKVVRPRVAACEIPARPAPAALHAERALGRAAEEARRADRPRATRWFAGGER